MPDEECEDTKIIIEPRGQAGCVFIMNLPFIKNGRAIADPWPVPVWVSFN